MRYLLDTDTCIDYLADRFPAVVRRFHGTSPSEIAVSSIAAAELRYSAAQTEQHQPNVQRLLDVFFADVLILEFDSAACLAYGAIRTAVERSGLHIPPNRLLVASQAIAKGMILVSGRKRQLAAVPDLLIENWRQN